MPTIVERTQNIASSRGFGWLLEQEEDEDDDLYSRPLLEELDVHPRAILDNMIIVLLPHRAAELRVKFSTDPDFWGPLAIVISYALLSVWGQLSALQWVVLLWVVGSLFAHFLILVFSMPAATPDVESADAALPPLPDAADPVLPAECAGEPSFAQTLAITGYCSTPLLLTALLVALVHLAFGSTGTLGGAVLATRIFGVAWPTLCATSCLIPPSAAKHSAQISYFLLLLYLNLVAVNASV